MYVCVHVYTYKSHTDTHKYTHTHLKERVLRRQLSIHVVLRMYVCVRMYTFKPHTDTHRHTPQGKGTQEAT